MNQIIKTECSQCGKEVMEEAGVETLCLNCKFKYIMLGAYNQ